ncbi:MAG TPA: hypothetical protein VGN57_08085 [Pirellulaceae bacterium]|jgi:hypothetical protein|nr:hypothetical protein [Pirellulaceae bacterium]
MDNPYAPPQAPSSEEPHRSDEGGDMYPLALTFLFWSSFVAIAVAVGVFVYMYYLELRDM